MKIAMTPGRRFLAVPLKSAELHFATLAMVTVLLMGGHALAQAKPSDPKTPAAVADQAAAPVIPAVPNTSETAQVTAHVEGFRSAKFGMSEADVRAAVGKDFPAAAASIKESTNPGERTKILSIKSADVLPDGGVAEVSYIFGYKSKALIQVAVVWSKQTDETLTSDALVANGEGLRGYFLGEGFPPSRIVSNAALPDGVLLFRGTDPDEHEVLLVLKGSASGEVAAQKVFNPTSTTLFYLARAKNPDVYKVPAGKF